jgi:hypothetical protein
MNDVAKKHIRSGSWCLAVLAFLGLTYLGVIMPPTVECLTDSPEIQYFVGPGYIFRYAHWEWTVPLGACLSVIILFKDRRMSDRNARYFNWTFLAVIILGVALWLQSVSYVRMVQIVH